MLKRNKSRHFPDIFLGLAVSTMLGDSILHIIPIFLGIHKHDEAGHEGWFSLNSLFFDFVETTLHELVVEIIYC